MESLGGVGARRSSRVAGIGPLERMMRAAPSRHSTPCHRRCESCCSVASDYQESTHLGEAIETSVDDSRSRRTEYSDIGSIVSLKVILLGHTAYLVAVRVGVIVLPVGCRA